MTLPSNLEEEIRRLQALLGPGVVFPPPCFTSMNARFIEYESRRSLTVTIPVGRSMLNPIGTMQGGFITAALDNVMGPLGYLALRAPAATLDIHTQFIRGALPDDILTIRAQVISRGPVTVVLSAEARNEQGKLIATASANGVALRKEPLLHPEKGSLP